MWRKCPAADARHKSRREPTAPTAELCMYIHVGAAQLAEKEAAKEGLFVPRGICLLVLGQMGKNKPKKKPAAYGIATTREH